MNAAEYATQHGLHRVGARPPLGAYLKEVWNRREFIYALARFRIEAENQRSRLGMGWVILKPVLNAMVYGAVFGFLMAGSRPDNFVVFLVVGVFIFEFFSSAFTSGSKSITSNAALVQSLSFPRMTLPLALIVQQFMMFVPVLMIMFAFVIAMGISIKLSWLLIIPMVLIYTLFNTGLTLITARLTVHFRDLSQLLPFIARFFFYTSGIFFSVEKRFKDHPIVAEIASYQPINEFLSLARGLIIGGDNPIHQIYWLYTSIWALGVLIFGIIYFWAAEERYGRED